MKCPVFKSKKKCYKSNCSKAKEIKNCYITKKELDQLERDVKRILGEAS